MACDEEHLFLLPLCYPEVIMKFTDRAIKALKPQASRYEVWEDTRPGFGIRVTTTGIKSWGFIYRFDGKPRRMTLGRYPAKSLA